MTSVFKKYQLIHTNDEFGYQRVTQLQEFNGVDVVGANPVNFEYTLSGDNAIQDLRKNIDDITTNLSTISISGDFDNDGKIDCISNNKLSIKMLESVPQTYTLPFSPNKMFTTNTLISNQLNIGNSILNIVENSSNITLNSYHFIGNSFIQDYSKIIVLDNTSLHLINCETPPATSNFIKTANKYLVGDFNNDGISELILITLDESKTSNIVEYESNPSGQQVGDTTIIVCVEENNNVVPTIADVKLIDLNPDASVLNNTQGYCSIITNKNWIIADKQHILDFNSDGKDDILAINNDGKYKVVGFKQLLQSPWIELELLGEGTLPYYDVNRPFLFGDFNGDGKTDIINPTAIDSSIWTIHISNPKPTFGNFFDSNNISTPIIYHPKEGGLNQGYTYEDYQDYLAIDANKDGKTDIVQYKSSHYIKQAWNETSPNHFTTWKLFTYVNLFGVSTNNFSLNYESPYHDQVASAQTFRPLNISYNHTKINADMVLLKLSEPWYSSYYGQNVFNKVVTYISFNKNVLKDNTISKIAQSNGTIIDKIEYAPMVNFNGVYKAGIATYPNSTLYRSQNNVLVSKIKNTSVGTIKYQDFKYYNYVVNYSGIGTIGFESTARSSWYKTISDKILWSESLNDLNKRGARIRDFSRLLDANVIYKITGTPTNLTMDSFNEYNPTTNSFPFALTLKKQTTINNLTNTTTEKSFKYSTDGFYLPTETTTNNYLGTTLQGTSVSKTAYSPNSFTTGTNYYIGRPESTTEINTAYSDTKSSITSLTYSGSNVQTITKTVGTDEASLATATEKIIETMDYFPNGNLKSKTLSAIGFAATTPAIASRTTSYTYGATNRFVKTSTDIDLLTNTNNTFDPVYGVVTKQTNALGQSTISTYDNWGKRTMITDFLGKTLTYNYSRNNNEYITTETGADGSESKTISDALGRVIKKGNKDLNGNWNWVNTDYDWQGKVIKISEPYVSTGAPAKWSTSEYDDYGRTIKTIAHTGQTTTYAYSGLTTTVYDGLVTKAATKNANGHTTTSTETPGGTITYAYNANGNMLTSNYGGVIMTMTYDLWGRKKSLDDPSAGLYTYEYNAYSELVKETNPKGFTDYTYTSTGKPLTKWIKDAITPTNTNIKSTYAYNATTKFLELLTVLNPYDGNSVYYYYYDTASTTPTYQLNKTVEDQTGLGVKFTKELSFDGFGRTLTEKLTSEIAGITSTKTVFNVYKNGSLFQTRDTNATGNIFWETNTVNARGQLTNAKMNNGLIDLTNTYDAFGYSKKIKHDKTGTIANNIMDFDYEFEPIRGNLKNRTNSFFGNKEYFYYDNNDRLKYWSPPLTNFISCKFDSGLDGFTYSAGTSNLTNENGKLKAFMYNNETLSKKLISFNDLKDFGNGYLERAFTLFLDIDFNQAGCNPSQPWYMNGCNNAKLHLKIYYRDFATNTTSVLEDYVFTNEGHYEFIESVTTTGEVSIKFEMESLTTNTNQTQFQFKLDNLICNQVDYEQSQTYDDRGRITDNNLGNYRYNAIGLKPYQQAKLKLAVDEQNYYLNDHTLQNVTYNAFKCPVRIIETANEAAYFGYNAMQQRSVMYFGGLGLSKIALPKRRFYSADGSMEVTQTIATATVPASYEFMTYLGGDAYSAPAVVKQVGNQPSSVFYLHRDYQGSILAISNNVGNIIEKRLFDPWGNVVKVLDGLGNNLAKLTFTDRGYTGHEHLQGLGMINMNARLYDPKLRRFLQTDNELQDPTKTQDYNRYGYCLNNPLKYTDPSGNNPLLIAVGIGMLISAGTYIVDCILNHTNINIGNMIQGFSYSIVSSMVTFGIGSAVSSIGNFFVKSSIQALSHGAFQGGMMALQGGNFWNGAAAGALSSFASSLWAGGDVSKGQFGGIGGSGGASMIAFGTIAGGAGAALTGGNFWQGAVTGLVVSGLNHALHDAGDDEGGDRGYDKDGNQINNNGVETTDYIYDSNGKIVNSTLVKTIGPDFGFGKLTIRGYGLKSYLSTGAINEDNTIANLFTGGKVLQLGLSYLGKVSITIYRVFGGGASFMGRSYTLFNPRYVPFYRNFAGLPDVNCGRFIIQGTIKVNQLYLGRPFAIPYNGNTGGLPLEFYQSFKQLSNPTISIFK